MVDFKIDKHTVEDAHYKLNNIKRRMVECLESTTTIKNEIHMQKPMQEIEQSLAVIENNMTDTINIVLCLANILNDGLTLYTECEKRICNRYYET